MATSKAFRNKASGNQAKRNQPVRVDTGLLSNSLFHGIAVAVPYNPGVKQLSPKRTALQASKVIFLKVNASLDKPATKPLNPKAAEARNMFAKYRKNH